MPAPRFASLIGASAFLCLSLALVGCGGGPAKTNVSGTGSVLVTVSLSKASSVPTDLEYSTTAGDAVRSTDFTAATGTVDVY